jgi:hypothetical protein
MINFKKIDDQDFIFVNQNLSEKDEKAFSDFLKNRKVKSTRNIKPKNTEIQKNRQLI